MVSKVQYSLFIGSPLSVPSVPDGFSFRRLKPSVPDGFSFRRLKPSVPDGFSFRRASRRFRMGFPSDERPVGSGWVFLPTTKAVGSNCNSLEPTALVVGAKNVRLRF